MDLQDGYDLRGSHKLYGDSLEYNLHLLKSYVDIGYECMLFTYRDLSIWHQVVAGKSHISMAEVIVERVQAHIIPRDLRSDLKHIHRWIISVQGDFHVLLALASENKDGAVLSRVLSHLTQVRLSIASLCDCTQKVIDKCKF